MLGLNLVDGAFVYAFYVPILSHLGFTEHFALLEGGALVMPWPHIATYEHLRDQP